MQIFFRRLGKASCGLVSALALSLLALFTSGGAAFAKDQDMTVLARASSGPISCEIRRNNAGALVELTGVISSSRAIAGNFRFTITKSGPSGSSNIQQANKFSVAADNELQVGHLSINIYGNARIAIRLFASSDDGIECQAEASLEH